ncbi:MAG: DUF3574 domain-containing protein [Acetobacteraceae bacterium]
MNPRPGAALWSAALVAVGLVAGCAAGPMAGQVPGGATAVRTGPAGAACPDGTRRMLVVELFFGRSIGGATVPGEVSRQAWAQFAADTLARAFPNGFTVRDARGAWRDPQSGRMVTEATKDVVVALDDGPRALARVRQATRVYRRRFRQTSVGLLVGSACGGF